MKQFKTLSNPSYEGIREGVISIFKKIGKKIDKNRCSKHWFYDHLKKNPTVKKAWNKISHEIEEEEEDFNIKMEEDIRSLSTAPTEFRPLEAKEYYEEDLAEESGSLTTAVAGLGFFELEKCDEQNYQKERGDFTPDVVKIEFPKSEGYDYYNFKTEITIKDILDSGF